MMHFEYNEPEIYERIKNGELPIGYNNKGLMQRFNPSEEAAKCVAKTQVGGTHYVKHNIQPWDIIDEYGLDYYRGNAIKYILRNKMNPREDIEKAIHYLEKWLEVSNVQ